MNPRFSELMRFLIQHEEDSPSSSPLHATGIAEFEGVDTPQLPQGGVRDPKNHYHPAYPSTGKQIDLHPGPDQGLAGQLGGLFGSGDYFWGPGDQSLQPHQPDQSADFEAFMRALMGSPKDERGRRVGAETDPLLWSRTAPRLENALEGPPIDYGLYDLYPSDNYKGRQDNQFLTPEQRGQVDDEFYHKHPWMVTSRGNRLSKDLPQDVQDAIRKDYEERGTFPYYRGNIFY